MAISRRKRLNLLKDVSAAFLQFRKTISSISDADLVRPPTEGKWTGKDIIVHVADWERVYAGVLEDRAANRPEVWPTEDDTHESLDHWSESQVTAKADWPLEDALEYLEQTHAELMELLERVQDITPEEAIEFTKSHYGMHYDALMACRSPRPQ